MEYKSIGPDTRENGLVKTESMLVPRFDIFIYSWALGARTNHRTKHKGFELDIVNMISSG